VTHRQVDAQAGYRPAAIFMLAASFGSLSDDAGRAVSDHHGRFDLVAVLSSGAGSPRPLNIAIRQQLVNRPASGVQVAAAHHSGQLSSSESRWI
jgi:hypothetical protein